MGIHHERQVDDVCRCRGIKTTFEVEPVEQARTGIDSSHLASEGDWNDR